MTAPNMTDRFGRRITYLRVSVTDRCDFRCVYCMAEDMTFLPRKDLLSLEEIDRLTSAFIARGVRKLRLTGGEPLVRRNIMWLVRSLSRHLGAGLDELTLTTNGSQLARYAEELAECGVKRINVSLDTLDPGKFRVITRKGDFHQVMSGIDAATTIRRRERYTGQALPIIALTAHAMEGDKERCLASGMNAYLSKPLTLVDLKAALDAVVAQKAARPADDRAAS